MVRTRVKICGITRIADAVAASDAGADAIGLVFYAPSARNLAVEDATGIVETVGCFVSTVGLFVNPKVDEVRRVLEAVPLDRLQFHGEESEAFCRQFGKPYIKALRAKPGANFGELAASFPSAAGILLDSYKPGVAGGTGEVFDWQTIPVQLRNSIILAGGLNPDNIAGAIRGVRPNAVDVSGGVESSPGVKSAEKIRAFIEVLNGE
ncbi:MAG: phosphoribosylanthranilate isomerase [Bermanella sp.]